MQKSSYVIGGATLLVLLAAGAWFGWNAMHPAGPPAAPAEAQAPAIQPVVAASAPPAPQAAAPEVSHPIEAAAAAASAPPDVDTALITLFGRRAVLTMFQLSDFPQRFVATVDNLGRTTASARLWPLVPVGGRFSVDQQAGAQVVGADNAQRYAPYVRLAEDVDPAAAVATYVRLYPLFQQAYADLGYPKRYFNDRLIEVIDLLLATPEPSTPLAVHQPVIGGTVQPPRPWVLYEFDDPALQSLAAGQRMLLRMGPDNERRVKARLAAIRRLLVAAEPRRSGG